MEARRPDAASWVSGVLASAGVWHPLDTHVLTGMARGLPIVYVLKWVRTLKERSDYGWFLRDDILAILTDTTIVTHTEGNVLEPVVVMVMVTSQYLLST